jgi:hypothetical protein
MWLREALAYNPRAKASPRRKPAPAVSFKPNEQATSTADGQADSKAKTKTKTKAEVKAKKSDKTPSSRR